MRTDILAYVVGWTLILFCIPLSIVALTTLVLGDGIDFAIRAFLAPLLFTAILGFSLKRWGTREDSIERLRDREAFAAVAIGWPVVVAIGALPYWLGGMFYGLSEYLYADAELSTVVVGYVHSWFESMSGFTTTGATVIDPSTSPICTAAVTDCIAAQPRSLLLWRSLTQWLGGMGIIMLGILIISRYLGGGMSVARAELTGPSLSRLRPRVAQTARTLWTIYIVLTVAEMALLRFVGKMSWFDAINHGFTTMPSGGYSTYDAGIMHFDSPTVEWIIIFFMVATGINFTLYHLLWLREWFNVVTNNELLVYIGVLLGAWTFMTANLVMATDMSSIDAFRLGAFQAASIGSSTGYATADFASWPILSKMILLLLMIVGACAGSTSGGLKIMRLRIAFLVAKREISRISSPRKVHVVRMDGEVVDDDKLWIIIGMLSWWAVIAMVGLLALSFMEYDLDLESIIGLVVSSLGNTGPTLGAFGPTQTWASLSWGSMLLTSGLMWLGRLELLTVLVLISPRVWKK
jgi:trk system potassium uptake protein TrkH